MPKTAEPFPTIWTTLWSDTLNTGTWRSAIPVYRQVLSPCRQLCPVHSTIPSWIDTLRNGDPYNAWLQIAANNPFPSVTGRVCHHPCETACNRSQHDETVSIKLLERYLGDLALEKGWSLPLAPASSKETIAIVGAGPAGLAAAYRLRLKGYSIEIFEKSPKPGGLLTYGIPAYRLPKEALDQEIERLLKLGIRLHTDSAIKSADDYSRLQHEYGILFISTGAQQSRKLPQFQDNPGIVMDGLEFLYEINNGKELKPGRKVLVIGGGNTAIDAARSAKRLGAEQVTIVYRRTEEQMPSQKSELIEAKEEQVNFRYLAAPVRLETENGTQKLLCQKMQLGAKDGSGRPRPEPIKDSCFALETDTIIMALGSEIEPPPIAGVETEGTLVKVDENQQTPARNILAGGDLTSNARFVSEALGAGKKAADQIDRLLGGLSDIAETALLKSEPLPYSQINSFYFPQNPAATNSRLDPAERLKSFKEVQLGITEKEAFYETSRCFNCGQCISCDNCFYYCPDMAIRINNTNEQEEGPYTILEQYCKGCGLCVKECPRGAIVLEEESK